MIMRYSLLLPLAALGLLQGVELPVVSLTVCSSGTIVEHAGRWPTEERILEGLPRNFERSSLIVTVDGQDQEVAPTLLPSEGSDERSRVKIDLEGFAGGGIRVRYLVPSAHPPWQGSEAPVGMYLTALAKRLPEEASTATQSLVLLAFLGAGYDHKTPNRYQPIIAQAVTRLQAEDPSKLDLCTVAWATMTLSEAFAMTADRDLGPRARAWFDQVRLRWPTELPALLASSQANRIASGPTTAFLIACMLASGRAAGFPVDQDLTRLSDLRFAGDVDGSVSQAIIGRFAGRKPVQPVPVATILRWIVASDRWWNDGRTDLFHQATMATFLQGGQAWDLWRTTAVQRLSELQLIRPGPDQGLWPVPQHRSGALAGSAQALLSIAILYRYQQTVKPQDRPASNQPTVESTEEKPAPKPNF